MESQNKGAVLVQIASLSISQSRNQNKSHTVGDSCNFFLKCREAGGGQLSGIC